MLTDEKKNEIFNALQGITYFEWLSIAHLINKSFDKKIGEHKENLMLAEVDELKHISH